MPEASKTLLLGFVAGVILVSNTHAADRDHSPKLYLAPSTERMAQRLESVTRSADIVKSPYMNLEKAEFFRHALAQGLDSKTEIQARWRLAEELLLAGRTEQAIEELESLGSIRKEGGSGLPGELQGRIRDQLALAHLRLGEQQNCIHAHNIDRCLLPIRGAGVHTRRLGSQRAIEGFRAALDEDSKDYLARWLLNIAYMTLGEYPDKVPQRWLIPAETFSSDYQIPRFLDVAPQVGLAVVGLSGGSITDDFNHDGWLDVICSSSGLRDQLRYFENTGDGRFVERTAEAGLSGLVGGLNLVHADYNNDGHLDVLVLRGGWLRSQGKYPNSLLRNNGDGTFDDVTEQAGLLSFHPTQTAAWGDYDNDGWIDLFIGNETFEGDEHLSELYHNNGDGTFTDVAADLELADLGYVKGVVWGDYNNDGRPDLYVSRLGPPNLLFRNDGPVKHESGSRPTTPALRQRHAWRFTNVTKHAGVAEPNRSFPAWFWDYNNDGWEDLLVAPYYTETLGDIARVHLGKPSPAERIRLYRNRGDGTFADVTKQARLDRVLLVMGLNFGDIDNDGFLDAYFGTGEPDFRALLPNRMLRNAGGKFFQDVTTAGGFGHLQKGHGISFGDLDNDGDQDIYAVMGGAYSGDVFANVLFENPGFGHEWITLALEGTESNRAAIGARVRLRVETPTGPRDIHRTVSSGGSFGASSLQLEVGLGQAVGLPEVEIRWPSGKSQILKDLPLRRRIEIREGDHQPKIVALKSARLGGAAGRAQKHRE